MDLNNIFNYNTNETEDLNNSSIVDIAKKLIVVNGGIIAPDTIGADYCFIDSFITQEMYFDFPAIERDFLKNCYHKLHSFKVQTFYGVNDARDSSPQAATRTKVLTYIYNGAKSGDEYCLALIKYLYKTYHKKEYNLLKRFHRITGKEIMNLAEDNDGNADYDSMGRLLGMCNFLGIELDSSCTKIYLVLEIRREKILQKAEELYDKDNELSEEVLDQNIEQFIGWIESTDSEKCRKLFHSNDHVYDFIKKCLNEYGFPADYLEYDMTSYSRTEQLITILSILKQIDPDKEITFDELFGYLPVINLVKTITSDCEYFQNEFCVLLGEKTKAEFDDLLLFDSSKIQVQPKKQATNTKMKLISNVAPIKTDEVNTTDYLEEISSLRTKLHEKENEIMRLKELYRSSKFARNEYANLQKKYEDQREELIALREFAYRSAKGFEELPQTTIDEMKSAVEKKEIIIVGGHTNWINKVQKFFPNWSIIPANASRTVDTNIFSGKEHVYFFTDYLDHNTYGKYITTCREKRIPFGYLHGVNIETMIQQIYKDICE